LAAEIEKIKAEIKKQKEEKERIERAQREEREKQQKLNNTGLCPAGYEWIAVAGGYRCSGGSHVVSEAMLK